MIQLQSEEKYLMKWFWTLVCLCVLWRGWCNDTSWMNFYCLQRQEYKQAIILGAEGGKVSDGDCQGLKFGHAALLKWSERYPRSSMSMPAARLRENWGRPELTEESDWAERKALGTALHRQKFEATSRSCYYPCWSLDPDCPTFSDWKGMELGRGKGRPE